MVKFNYHKKPPRKGKSCMKSIAFKSQKMNSKNEIFPLLPARFDNNCVSSVASFAFREHFKQKINIQKLYQSSISYVKGANSTFSGNCVIDYLYAESIEDGKHHSNFNFLVWLKSLDFRNGNIFQRS